MNWYGWNYVLVLNLSDLRNTKSEKFIEEYNRLNDPFLSLFSHCRNKERKQLLQKIEMRPVIVAWGVNKTLQPLSTQALSKLPKHIYGLKGEASLTYQYLHPWPRKGGEGHKWFMRFIEEIRL